MTGVRLAVLACAVLLPAALHAQGVAPAREKAMRDAQWGPIRQDDGTYAYLSARSDEDMDHFRDLLDKAQWSDVNGVDCDQHQKDMKKFLNGAPMYWAVDKMSEDGGRDGQTLRATDGNVVEFISVFEWKSRSDDGMLNLLLHEGWHWINKETKEGVNALRAEFQQLVEEQRELMVKDELDKVYTDGGGTSLNAFTSNDFTVYINQLPANRMELWFWLESDRLLNPVFREFYAERDVVYEERRLRTESTPTGRYDEQADAMFWQSHPYSWPVIGWASDLEVISKSQADEFFATYYAPNNLSAVLVGNFDSAEVRELAERYFGRLPRAERPAPDVVTLEAEQLAEKRMTGECDCQPQLQVRYHAVPFGHGDGYALDVVAGVLNGRTGRLYEQIVEGAEIASSASAFYEARKYAGVFNLRAETKGDATPEQLLAAWDGIVAELIAEPVPDDELAKVKNRVSADTYRQLRDPFFLMIQLAVMDALGDWRYLNTVAERTNEVTAEDVQRVAAKYFEPSKRLVSLYYRKEGTEATETPSELEALPPEMRTALMSQAEAIAQIEDPAQLEMVLQQMEAQSAQVPEEMRPALDWMRGVIEERLAELQAELGEEDGEGGEQ